MTSPLGVSEALAHRVTLRAPPLLYEEGGLVPARDEACMIGRGVILDGVAWEASANG